MINIKQEKGITIITLIVSIIVILILAGITINLSLGNNGLLTESKQIAENITMAEQEANDRINAIKSEESNIIDGTISLTDEKAPIINGLDVTQITNNSIEVSVNVTEAESGIAKIEYSIDNGVTYVLPIVERSKQYTFKNLLSGTDYTVKVRVTDNNGNATEASTIITIE